MSDEKLLAGVTEAVRAAGALLDAQERPAVATTWPQFLTTFRAAEAPAAALLQERLAGLRPGVEWIDEFEQAPPDDGEYWVVDVMDGAVQYLQGMPLWCVSVTLLRDGRPAVAVLHHPRADETYSAAAGQGARRDGLPISPGRKQDLSMSLLATSAPPGVGKDADALRRAGRSLSAALAVAGAVRNLGPTSWQIAEVAGGRIDAFWQYGSDAPNLIGASLIAAEAGAVVSDGLGAPWTPASECFVAASPSLHAPLLDALKQIQ